MSDIISHYSSESKSSSYSYSKNISNYKTIRRREAYNLSKLHNLSSNQEKVFLAYIDCCDKDGRGTFGHKFMANRCNLSLRTIKTISMQLRRLGLISSKERQGWNLNKPAHERTNITTLLFIETKLTVVSAKFALDPNNLTSHSNLNLEDRDLNKHREHVSISSNLEKPKDKPKTQTINPKEFEINPEIETLRFCKAFLLTEKQIEIVKKEMKSPTIVTPIGYLANMVKKIIDGSWGGINMKETKTYSSEELARRKELEDHLEEVAMRMAINKMTEQGIPYTALKKPIESLEDYDEYCRIHAKLGSYKCLCLRELRVQHGLVRIDN